MADKFHNIETGAIADEYGALDLQIKAMEKRASELKDELKRRAGGDDVIEGSKFTVTVSTTTSTRIDTKKLRDALGDAVKEVEVTLESVRLTVKPTVIFNQSGDA